MMMMIAISNHRISPPIRARLAHARAHATGRRIDEFLVSFRNIFHRQKPARALNSRSTMNVNYARNLARDRESP